jgi:hypothetical protein
MVLQEDSRPHSDSRSRWHQRRRPCRRCRGADVREEVLVGKGVVGRRDAVSSRAEALPKNLIAPHLYRFTRGGVPETYCPVVRCTPEEGMEKV